jgi:hypothetical protein
MDLLDRRNAANTKQSIVYLIVNALLQKKMQCKNLNQVYNDGLLSLTLDLPKTLKAPTFFYAILYTNAPTRLRTGSTPSLFSDPPTTQHQTRTPKIFKK